MALRHFRTFGLWVRSTHRYKYSRLYIAGLMFAVGAGIIAWSVTGLSALGLMALFTVFIVFLGFGVITNYTKRNFQEYKRNPLRRLLGL